MSTAEYEVFKIIKDQRLRVRILCQSVNKDGNKHVQRNGEKKIKRTVCGCLGGSQESSRQRRHYGRS